MKHEELHKSLLATNQKQTFETYYSKIDESYGDATASSYHQHRLDVIGNLIKGYSHILEQGTTVDFGCGDGLFGEILAGHSRELVCIDPSEFLLNKCEEKLCKYGNVRNIVGAVDELKKLETDSVMALTAFDVLDYLTEEEEKIFYQECSRIIKKDGVIISSHSNELFDLFTFNRYTVNFFKNHYQLDVSPLVSNPKSPNRSTANIRGNPLSHNSKVAPYSFQVNQTAFLMQHDCPPLLNDAFDPDKHEERNYPNTDAIDEADRWKLLFNCSVFCVACQKV